MTFAPAVPTMQDGDTMMVGINKPRARSFAAIAMLTIAVATASARLARAQFVPIDPRWQGPGWPSPVWQGPVWQGPGVEFRERLNFHSFKIAANFRF
jgi:hypothetical protein